MDDMIDFTRKRLDIQSSERSIALKEELEELERHFAGIWKSKDGRELSSETKVKKLNDLFQEASEAGGGYSSYHVVRGLKLIAARQKAVNDKS